MIAAVTVLAIGGAVARLVAWRRAAQVGFGPPPGYSASWRCRATGFETNLIPDAVVDLVREGKMRSDPARPLITLLRCPDCGKLELEPVTITPQGRVSL